MFAANMSMDDKLYAECKASLDLLRFSQEERTLEGLVEQHVEKVMEFSLAADAYNKVLRNLTEFFKKKPTTDNVMDGLSLLLQYRELARQYGSLMEQASLDMQETIDLIATRLKLKPENLPGEDPKPAL